MHPYLSSLEYSDDGTTYTELALIRSLTLPVQDRGETDTTHLKSTNMYRTFTPSWKDTGMIEGTAELTDAQLTVLRSLYNTLPTASLKYFRITLPAVPPDTTGARWVSRGFLKTITPSAGSVDGDDDFTVDFSIRCSGEPTYTEGA